MPMSFKPLQHLLVERGMVKVDLVRQVGLSSATVAKLWKGGNVELSVIDRLCTHFQVPIEQVVQYVSAPELQIKTVLNRD